jgi:hypothetical protein
VEFDQIITARFLFDIFFAPAFGVGLCQLSVAVMNLVELLRPVCLLLLGASSGSVFGNPGSDPATLGYNPSYLLLLQKHSSLLEATPPML